MFVCVRTVTKNSSSTAEQSLKVISYQHVTLPSRG